jgi:cyclophilin family peptidyl-prolyl cis-trans isomerase
MAARLSALLLSALIATIATQEQHRAQTPAPASSSSSLRSSLRLSQIAYEKSQVVRGDLTIENLSDKWVAIPNGEELAKGLRLRLPDGKEVQPNKPEQFAAARTKELGPGGFTGFAFDAALLFPQLQTPGRYELTFTGPGLSASAAVRIIEEFDPSKKFELTLTTKSGKIVILLDPSLAPVAVRNVVNLTRLEYYNGANITVASPGNMLSWRGDVSAAHRIVPFEPAMGPLLAGSVVLEPSELGGSKGSWPNLAVLLSAKPDMSGKVVSVGRVTAGFDIANKLAGVTTSGPSGRPPFQPLEPVFIVKAEIRELDTSPVAPGN